MDNTTFATNQSALSTTPPSHFDSIKPSDRSVKYILVPVLTLLIVVALSITVILLLQRKRRMDRLRHHLMPFYNFAPGEEEDWESELLENENDLSVKRDYNTLGQGKRDSMHEL